MQELEVRLIHGPTPTRFQQHPATIAYQPGWQHWITLECGNPQCAQHWHAPANRITGEPDIAVWGRDIIACPHCGTTTLAYPPDPKSLTT